MKRVLKIIGKSLLAILIFAFLTALTQVGGIAYLLNFTLRGLIHRITPNGFLRASLKVFSFCLIYSIVSFVITPLIAKPLGRVPLPVTSEIHLRPANLWTCILNRHYVTPELREMTIRISRKMYERYPSTIVTYLDGSFPFVDGFPLLPHQSHDDGKKLDFAFFYNRVSNGKPTHELPSWIGYGVYEGPNENELDQPAACAEAGAWQYNILESIVPQSDKSDFMVNAVKTTKFIDFFANEPEVERIFLEPHLKTRWELTSPKIGFHGCHAIRHDDHVHIQLR